MDLSLLATLEKKLVEATHFASVMEYFFDHFAEKSEFFDVGEPTRDNELERAILEVTRQLFPDRRAVVMSHRLIQIPGHNFIHGPITLDGKRGTIIYFTSSNAGLLGLDWGTESKFIRFRGRPAPARTLPSEN